MKVKIMKDGVETEIEVAAVYETQADLDNALKSERSKGQNEILKELGSTSVNEIKTKMGAQTKVEELEGTINKLSTQLEREQHLRIANEIGVAPEFIEDAITLAKANMGEGKDFKTVLETKSKAVGFIKKPDTKKDGETGPTVIGAPKTAEQEALEAKEEAEMERLRNL